MEVCTVVGEVCEVCGSVTDDSAASWVTVLCRGGGIEGKFLTVGYPVPSADGDVQAPPLHSASQFKIMSFCEIEIYGEVLHQQK